MARRHRWLLSGTLLILAGGLTWMSTWRHWSACRPDPHDPACLLLEDATVGLPLWAGSASRSTSATLLAVAAAALLALAWLLVGDWARGSVYRTGVMLFVGLQPLLVALLVTLELAAPGHLFGLVNSGWLWWPAELLVFPMLLGQGWLVEESPIQLLRLLLLGWGTTSLGPLHAFADHVGSMVMSPVTAQSPPGLGYVTAATQVLTGLAVIGLSLLIRRRPRPEDGDELTGRDGFTLAA